MRTTETKSVEKLSTRMKGPVSKIAEHPFLRTISHAHLESICWSAEEITFEPEEVIFREGQPAKRFYLIQEGQVALEAHTLNHGDTPILKIGRGDVLGWSWLFEPFVWHFKARALERTTAIALDGGHLLVSCEENHEFGYELMKGISHVVIHRLEATWRRLIEGHPLASLPPVQATERAAEQFELEGAVARHPLFASMSAAHLKVLLEHAMHARFEAGDLVFEAGDPANRFYIIEQGRVELESDSPNGPVLIQILGRGDVLGWSWLYAPYYWHFNARALQATSAIFFYGTRLREACEFDHDLGYELLKRVTRVVIQRLQVTRRQLLKPVTGE